MSVALNGILGPEGGGGGSGDVTGPASATDGNLAQFGDATGKVLEDSGIAAANVVTAAAAGTDNAVPRFDGATKALQDSGLIVSDVAAGAVTFTSSAGTAITVKNTNPAATTGASVAGDGIVFQAGDAVASTDTAGAAAGGDVTIQAGAASRFTSGNANGGSVNLVGGAGIGTGVAGGVAFPVGSTAINGLYFTGVTSSGWLQGSVLAQANHWTYSASGTPAFGLSGVGFALASSKVVGWTSTPSAVTGAADLSLSRIAAGQLAVNNATNGMANNIKIATTTVTASGATSTASNLVPAGCILLGVTTRVITAITSGDGGTSVDIGNGTDPDMYGNDIAFTLGTTTNLASHTASALAFKSAAESVVFTCNGGTFSGGAWRVCAHYLDLTAPTS